MAGDQIDIEELIIAIRCFGQSLGEATERLDAMRTGRLASDRSPDAKGFGFANQKIVQMRGTRLGG